MNKKSVLNGSSGQRKGTAMLDLNPCPCKDCIVRSRFAIGLDMHFWGDDCPYKCDAYETWRHRAGEGEKDKHEID